MFSPSFPDCSKAEQDKALGPEFATNILKYPGGVFTPISTKYIGCDTISFCDKHHLYEPSSYHYHCLDVIANCVVCGIRSLEDIEARLDVELAAGMATLLSNEEVHTLVTQGFHDPITDTEESEDYVKKVVAFYTTLIEKSHGVLGGGGGDDDGDDDDEAFVTPKPKNNTNEGGVMTRRKQQAQRVQTRSTAK